MKLFMLILGCKPPARKTEQHDVFFGIGDTLNDLVPQIIHSWEGAGKIHIDAWREVTIVDGYEIQVIPKQVQPTYPAKKMVNLFFINLGGYKKDEFEEFHYKMLIACADKAEAIERSKASAFYKHTGFKGAPSHIDDKYGVDVDDVLEIEDALSPLEKERYDIGISPVRYLREDELHLGYFVLDRL